MRTVALRLIQSRASVPRLWEMSALKNGRCLSTDSNKVDEPFKVEEAEPVYVPPPSEKLLVLGGNGFVGTHVCKEALDRSLSVASLSSHPDSAHPDSANELVSVWWDVKNCSFATNFLHASKVSQYITAAVQSVGIRLRDPIQINAYGDLSQLKQTNVHDLSSSGINLMQIAPDGKGGADKYLQADLIYWAEQNPPPAHILLISGDKEFAPILHRLRLDNYNILLVTRESVHCSLMSPASVMWIWKDLLDGNLTASYFNQPPDRSLYGHYEGPLEDPFSVIERTVYTLDEDADQQEDYLVPHAFSEDIFWRDMLTFLNSPLGSLIISESISRGNLAYYLHKNGPGRRLSKRSAVHMIEILISDKKWLLHSPHLSSPFKLHQGVTSVYSHPHVNPP